MKELLPDLKYCRLLKGITTSCTYWINGKGKILPKKAITNYKKWYPAPTAAEMVRELSKENQCNICSVGMLNLIIEEDKNLIGSAKKLENALAEALIKLK